MVPAQGVLVTLAIGLHNVPEGLAVASVLVARGVSARQALLWTLVTSAPQPLVALPAFLFVDAFTALLPVALGFAAGCMVWMVFAELLPDALEDAPHPWVRRIPQHCPVFAAFLSCLRHCVRASLQSNPGERGQGIVQVATVATFAAAGLEGLRMLLATFEGPDGSLRGPAVLAELRLLWASAFLALLVLPAVAACAAPIPFKCSQTAGPAVCMGPLSRSFPHHLTICPAKGEQRSWSDHACLLGVEEGSATMQVGWLQRQV